MKLRASEQTNDIDKKKKKKKLGTKRATMRDGFAFIV